MVKLLAAIKRLTNPHSGPVFALLHALLAASLLVQGFVPVPAAQARGLNEAPTAGEPAAGQPVQEQPDVPLSLLFGETAATAERLSALELPALAATHSPPPGVTVYNSDPGDCNAPNPEAQTIELPYRDDDPGGTVSNLGPSRSPFSSARRAEMPTCTCSPPAWACR
ncbi:MAG: hypothetical protein ACOYYS_14505 [Chloroflexota bacterium]